MTSFNDLVHTDKNEIYYFDVNRDGTKDAVINDPSNDEILVFLNVDGEYKYKYKSGNYNFQGVYMVVNIREEKGDDVNLSLISMFSGAGGQEKKYFLGINDNKLELVQTVTFDYSYNNESYSLRICVIKKSGKEKCHVKKSDKPFNSKYIDEYPYTNVP
ncbi:hypothetical protein VR7878_03209 [Vibrio ruber DSM 16370]|uniref:Uncharacterized protein n=1 Tax=Vibrio ruber (strain DSM 16370 / JCM 11486 / BCRC 17186 / CECT 7878 / LMG 23124 / VR1) TaxID=1123498 RepID=A0A1R4LRD0_VIBR1|nr:hypothetical protein [Vibrio ruber]SJN59075.1 hypothetical protein VR7878_03209 [Vibrio ruber DSM 16370]